ncbi:hypothetical protein [Psychrobium sp. 1_MG-2023]|uniref:hypothetical protein n=1 Tax=Psychrobium sp. 1_MG-2023 TaxID=3062624 RepID=UPI000C34653C|nr:hypothetical protein [Psychrobium sp. 1_MG-2023]MDP2560177.1 hypothetical protein [Psychrobium sp. 1_MG-2023]PKF56988.1 hypothetical protein CW748_07790 [Alteromonadales bacterium alter-6D02]
MNVFTMVVIIVTVCVIGDVFKRAFDYKNKKKQIGGEELDKLIAINEQLNTKVKSLESRVINLEAIVTGEGYDLKNKIDSL